MTLGATPGNDLVRELKEAARRVKQAGRPPPPADLPPLMQWIPKCDPAWHEPRHVAELVDILEVAPRGGLRIMVGCPIRHYKTGTVQAAIGLWLRRDPSLRVIYMTYSIGRASEMGKDIRDLCKRVGVEVDKTRDTIMSWRTKEGGGVDTMSAQQSRLGADVDVLVVDDPFESPEEADRLEVRDAVDKTITHYTMRLSRGGSTVLVMSRFHPDDAIGRRVDRKAESWSYVHKRAIEVVDGVEVPLSPEVRTLDELHAIRAALAESDPNERLWWSQWQNEPQTPNASLFGAPLRYVLLPGWPGWRDGIGLDAAYSPKRGADWFALVRGRVWAGELYLTHVERFRADEGLAETRLRAVWQDGQPPIWSYMSGPEVGAAHNLASKGLPVQVIPARFGKLIRARKCIDRCNGGADASGTQWPGRVLVPAGAEWDSFVRRLTQWRALESDDDDEIDALVSLHDGLFGSGCGVSPAWTCGRPRM